MVCESGVGNTDKPNPQIRLEISRDGAVFEDPRTRFLGEIGNRKIRQVWYKNGRVSRAIHMKMSAKFSTNKYSDSGRVNVIQSQTFP